MRLIKLSTALSALLLLLSACSTVKLDEAASVETRKTSAVAPAEAKKPSASVAQAASNNSDTSAAQSNAASSADGVSTTGTNTAANVNPDANANSNSNANAEANAKANATFNEPLSDPSSILANRSIYFDLDSYIVKDEYKSVIDAHGKYLASRPDQKVRIQGNTDERGGSEYNLALGQKRADAVRRALAQRGVPESQMEAVSYGKEKPKAMGSNEEAWKENRRADIAY
jgi:peptidoglycan-associated lipoprotein